MKKLLLALAVLVGLVLPSMAKDCSEYSFAKREDNNKRYESILRSLGYLMDNNDLECLEYFVDVEGVKIEDMDSYRHHTLIEDIFDMRKTKPEILSFVLNHEGINPVSSEINNIISWFLNMLYGFKCDAADADIYFKKFEILMHKYPDAWGMIDDGYVRRLVQNSIYSEDPLHIIKLLLEKGLPLSEYDRYVQVTKKEIEKIENLSVNNYEEILENNKLIEAGNEIIRFLEQTKRTELQEINNNMKKILSKINEENLSKIEQETQNRYNYQF